jgi:CHAT domain-containing protein
MPGRLQHFAMPARAIAAFVVLISIVHPSVPAYALQAALASSTASPSLPVPLVLGQPIKRQATAGQRDVFTLQVRQGQFFAVVAEQQGADVVVELDGSDGKSLVQVDSPNGEWGPEPACILANQTGAYQVVISTSTAKPHGSYTLKLTTLRDAEPSDKDRIELQNVIAKAVTFLIQGDFANSRAAYKEADVLAGKVGDLGLQAIARHMEGQHSIGLGEMQTALEDLQQALPLLQKAGNRSEEAIDLSDMGLVYERLSDYQKAIDLYNQSLAIDRELGATTAEGTTLSNLGNVYGDMGETQKALDYQNQALLMHQASGDRDSEATDLSNIGVDYQYLGELQKALEYYNRALPLYKEAGDRYHEATLLNNIAYSYDSLNDEQKAVDYFNQALAMRRAVGDRDGEATTLDNLAQAYEHMHDFQRSLDTYNQALPITRQVRNRNAEAITLGSMGLDYAGLGDQQKALDLYNQALVIHRQVGDRADEATTLRNIGRAYEKLGDTKKAFDFYRQALPIATEIREPLNEASLCAFLMRNRRAEQPVLAIYFGKQAINFLQQMRSGIKGLDADLQKSFLALNENIYHDLASLLIDQGRLPEAEQVLDLLKQQEYTDYVRGNPSSMLGPLSLTPAERQAEEDYEKSTAQIVQVSQQWSDLRKNKARTPDEEKQYQQLSDQLDKANQGLDGYYARLFKLFGANGDANKQVADVKGDVSVLKDQIIRLPHTMALYTMLTSDRYTVIVITSAAPVARSFSISAADLNQKIAAFQQVLRDPSKDPHPAAQDLYNILVGPVKADLDQARPQTLIWSLDGVLRYIPLAALYDGRQYLVESYNLVAVNPASFPHLGDHPQMDGISALAMGISQKYENNLNPLPSVVTELDDIVKDPQVTGADGVLPGSILLNSQFTQAAMERQLEQPPAIVHIASHFVFAPGDDSASYLLLAGKNTDSTGYHLTVADFRDNPKLSLDGTDLLTLSACDTGVGSAAGNGREVDGLAMTAQRKGAKAVISSLWEVDDASTGELMADFYKRWADGGGKVMKVEALRQAQLDLLRGAIHHDANAGRRGFQPVDNKPDAPPADFAHPYYWAPFVLTGNWR